jgi:hypothetical protein
MAGRVGVLVGSEIVNVRSQSTSNALDLAFLVTDERVLELFSDYIYDDWLLTIDKMVIEGPIQ